MDNPIKDEVILSDTNIVPPTQTPEVSAEALAQAEIEAIQTRLAAARQKLQETQQLKFLEAQRIAAEAKARAEAKLAAERRQREEQEEYWRKKRAEEAEQVKKELAEQAAREAELLARAERERIKLEEERAREVALQRLKDQARELELQVQQVENTKVVVPDFDLVENPEDGRQKLNSILGANRLIVDPIQTQKPVAQAERPRVPYQGCATDMHSCDKVDRAYFAKTGFRLLDTDAPFFLSHWPLEELLEVIQVLDLTNVPKASHIIRGYLQQVLEAAKPLPRMVRL